MPLGHATSGKTGNPTSPSLLFYIQYLFLFLSPGQQELISFVLPHTPSYDVLPQGLKATDTSKHGLISDTMSQNQPLFLVSCLWYFT